MVPTLFSRTGAGVIPCQIQWKRLFSGFYFFVGPDGQFFPENFGVMTNIHGKSRVDQYVFHCLGQGMFVCHGIEFLQQSPVIVFTGISSQCR